MEVTNETYLLYCIDCGAGFFTEGEKEFYESKGLTIPTRCKNCREKRKNAMLHQPKNAELPENARVLYEEILTNWSVEARKEQNNYFYYIQEVNDIISI